MEKTPELSALYEKRHAEVLSLFTSCDPSKIYEKIIEIGRKLPSAPREIEIEANLVSGCQSIAYLSIAQTPEGLLSYRLQSEALISKGLGALLLAAYDNAPLELILLYPPLFIQELGLHKSLSPGRSNGLASLYARMKKEALRLYAQKHAELNF